MTKDFYITTTLPYVNAKPHIGFALEIVQADTLARFKRTSGYNVVFNTGTDEHGQKIYEKALEEKKDPQTYCDEYAAKFDNLKSALNLSYTNFTRTTNNYHIKAATEFWKLCDKNGDIYKKNYKMKYCVGCELEKTDSELVNGHCPIHPNKELQIIEEENYFFRFSKYQQPLLEFYETHPQFVQPDFRFKEIKEFVKRGLEDFSISRLKKKMPWGIDVPGDTAHVMYVWFDALINYISTIGWPHNMTQFNRFWPGLQTAGKDNLRQQSAIWQAMLMSAGVNCSKQIFIHGFINVNGQKMSKSLGNVIDPFDLVHTYGTDAVRFYLLREIPSLDDGDFSSARMTEIYNKELANELGNLVLRVTTIAEKDGLEIKNRRNDFVYNEELSKLFDQFQFNKIVEVIWQDVRNLNKKIDEFVPWKKTPEERKEFLVTTLQLINSIGNQLAPFIPQTAEKIVLATQGKIRKIEPLFPRIKV